MSLTTFETSQAIMAELNPPDAEMEWYEAAMYAALGKQCQLSRSGYSVIFTPECRLHDRADLSGMPGLARRQLEHAGIDPDQVTDVQVAAWREWSARQQRQHAIATARFVVTAAFNEPYLGDTGSCGRFNNVRLTSGGEVLALDRIECLERWDKTAHDQMGRPGAVVHYPDSNRIRASLDEMRQRFPELAGAPVTDNAGLTGEVNE